MPCLTKLHSLFYPNGVKIIPNNIYEVLTPTALAHLIMGDGSVQRHGLALCTDSYSIEDVVRLINVLMIRYRLECTLRFHRPTHPRINIRQRSMPLLRTILRPHMHSSMAYKLGEHLSFLAPARIFVKKSKSKTRKSGEAVQLIFQIAQHSRDSQLISSFLHWS
jgi:hypothetical protein